MKKLALFILVLITTGCAGGWKYSGRYNISLSSVERPKDSQIQFGETKIVDLTVNDEQKYSYADSLIDVIWIVNQNHIGFILKNNSNHSITIPWDEVVYVNVNGQSSRVIHNGIKYIDMNQPQAPTLVAKHSSITDAIFPVINIHNAPYVGWQHDALLPIYGKDKVALTNAAREYIGKSLRIVMPLIIEGVTNEYTFVFGINGFSLNNR